jgi:hypothetical protein
VSFINEMIDTVKFCSLVEVSNDFEEKLEVAVMIFFKSNLQVQFRGERRVKNLLSVSS